MTRVAVSGIVLAGGRSSRFGRPKLEARLDGAPLLELAIGALAGLCSELIVALPPEAEGREPGLPAIDGQPPIAYVHDPEPFGGPLVGLAIALAAATRPLAIVVGGDMPRLRPAVLAAMLHRLEAAPDPAKPGIGAVVLGPAGTNRPLPMAVRVAPAALAGSEALTAGERSLRALLGRLEVAELPVEAWRPLDPDAETLIDVDVPADLAALHRTHPG